MSCCKTRPAEYNFEYDEGDQRITRQKVLFDRTNLLKRAIL